jgi:pimeloyl-ACP methyl ester carboxylesterase
MFTRKTFNNYNLKLSYLEWTGKTPLLLLHGLADHGLVWSNLGEYLVNEYNSIAPDLRGHGYSSKPEQGYCFRDYIEDLEALMDYLQWQDCHILGHSWGAKLAAIWATQHPARFRSLILVDPFFIDKMPNWIDVTFPIFYKILPFLKVIGPFPSYEAAEKIAKSLKQYQGWTPLQQQIFREGMEQKADGNWGSKFVKQARDEIFADVMRVQGLIRPLDIPTLLIKPKQGLNRTQWQLKPYKTYLNQLTIREVPGNHWAFLVEPNTFNHTVKEFLSKFEYT